MKRIPIIVIFFLFLQVYGYGQIPSRNYAISLGAFIDVNRSEFAELDAFGFLYTSKLGNNYTEVLLGGYNSLEAAQTALGLVIASGYSNARLREFAESEGAFVTVIQIASLDRRNIIDWKKYSGFTSLWGIAGENSVKLMIGPYTSPEEARQALPKIQKSGYKDAFSRNVNSIHLIKIGAFETGNVINQSSAAFSWQNKPSTPSNPPSKQPDGYDYPSNLGPVPGLQAKNPEVNGINKSPNIRGNIKRKSALELQKLLKAARYYTGSLDGYYGKGTEQAFQIALQNNQELIECRFIALSRPSQTTAPTGDALQNIINRLPEDARANILLEGYNHPLAYAYRAYYLFTAQGPGSEVNDLMNTAIRQAYVNRSNRLVAPFDYRSTYAYNDLGQLILHLHYIHIAPDGDHSVPCWLSKSHPQETGAAQASLAGTNLKVQVCDGHFDWEEIQMLDVISAGIGGRQASGQALAEATAARAVLFNTTRPMSAYAQKEIENWQNTLFAKLSPWANSDILHLNKFTAFSILYYQSAVLLEDFYMDKGFTPQDARFLAVATLRTFTGPNLERFQ
ncbi:MAG: peptidoglycan-binding domain-containing protein [Saprospiraceae bacterium]|jgi:hypothetical protein